MSFLIQFPYFFAQICKLYVRFVHRLYKSLLWMLLIGSFLKWEGWNATSESSWFVSLHICTLSSNVCAIVNIHPSCSSTHSSAVHWWADVCSLHLSIIWTLRVNLLQSGVVMWVWRLFHWLSHWFDAFSVSPSFSLNFLANICWSVAHLHIRSNSWFHTLIRPPNITITMLLSVRLVSSYKSSYRALIALMMFAEQSRFSSLIFHSHIHFMQ